MGQGRPLGSKNKPRKWILEIYAEVFELMGGVDRFLEWAKKNPSQFYNAHGRMSPVRVN
jgi:dihydroorotase